MDDPAIKRGKGGHTTTPTDDDGYIQRLVDWVQDLTKPIENTGGQIRSASIDEQVAAQTNPPPKRK